MSTSIVIMTWSEPPRLGSILSEYRLYTSSIVIDLDDDNGADDETSSEPPGLGLTPIEPRLSALIVIDLDDDDGIAAIPSKPPAHGSHLSSSIDDGIGTAPGGSTIRFEFSRPPEVMKMESKRLL